MGQKSVNGDGRPSPNSVFEISIAKLCSAKQTPPFPHTHLQALSDLEGPVQIIYVRKWTVSPKRGGRKESVAVAAVSDDLFFLPCQSHQTGGYLLLQIQPASLCLRGNVRLIPITRPNISATAAACVNCVEGKGLPPCVASEKKATIAIV